jgi:hypothetical protein
MNRLRIILVALCVAGCGADQTTEAPTCLPIVEFSPTTATIHVGETVNIAFRDQPGCRTIGGIRVEGMMNVGFPQASRTGMTVIGVAPGEGRIRLTSGVDPSVSDVVVITVLPAS